MLEPATAGGQATAEPRPDSSRETLRRYRETFDRHRLLFCAPIVLSVVVAMWSVLGSPKSYESHASLWVDNPPPSASSVANTDPAVPTPAEQEQAVISELLKTRDFTLAVGRGGPLAAYIADHSGRGWSPMGLLARMRGAGQTDDRILAALDGKRLTSAVAGPQVLQVSYKGPTPAVAAGTLSSLLTQLRLQATQLAQLRGQGALAYYQAQVDAASKAGVSVRRQLAAYLRENGNVAGDATLTALRTAARGAANRLARATAKLNLASGAVLSPATAASEVQVVDPPTVPTHATSGKKTLVVALLASLFAGTLIAVLGVIALSPGRPEDTEVWEAPHLVPAQQVPTARNHPAPRPATEPQHANGNGSSPRSGKRNARRPKRTSGRA